MKINPINSTTPIQGPSPVKRAYSQLPAGAASRNDEVVFSAAALSMNKLAASVKGEQRLPAEQSRKDEIAARIAAGTYQIGAKAVADKIIAEISE